MPEDHTPTPPPGPALTRRRVLPADRVEVICDLRAGVPEGDQARGAAVEILTGFDEGALLAPGGYLHRYLDTAEDRHGNPRLTLRYHDLYTDVAEQPWATSPNPDPAGFLTGGGRYAVLTACALVTGQRLPDLDFVRQFWSRDNAAVILGGLAMLLGFTGDSPGAVVPHLMGTVAAYEDTQRRLRNLCRAGGEGGGAALMREVDEPTGAGGRPLLPGALAVLVEDVQAILAGQPCAADSTPEPARDALRRSNAVLDLHPTTGPAPVNVGG